MNDQSFDPRPLGKGARNERRKLRATTANTIGLAIFAVGFLTPALTTGLGPHEVFKSILSIAISLALHLFAVRLLKRIED